jgi:hypothetical protein
MRDHAYATGEFPLVVEPFSQAYALLTVCP